MRRRFVDRAAFTLGLLVALFQLAADARAQDLNAVVAQFYPQELLNPTEPLPQEQCYAVLDVGSNGQAHTIVAAYTNSYVGAVRVIERSASGFSVVAQPTRSEFSGWSCAVEALDVSASGRNDAHVSFISRDSTSDWIYRWDGQQLIDLTPTAIDSFYGATSSNLRNASFVDVNGDGVLEAYSFSQPSADGSTPEAGEIFKLSGTHYITDRPVVGLFTFNRSEGSPTVQATTLSMPVGARGPFTLRILNGSGIAGARVENAVESARVWLDDVQIAGSSDFGTAVATIDRTISLRLESVLKVRLGGTPGGRITVIVDAAGWGH